MDETFGDADKISIDDAINNWNYVLANYIKLEVISYDFHMGPTEIKDAISNDDVLILKIDSKNELIPIGKNWLAFSYVGGNKIYLIRDRISNEAVEQVSLHELGHILGSQDLDGNYLMGRYFSKNYYQCVDEYSLEQVAKYQNLDINKLNYCVYGN